MTLIAIIIALVAERMLSQLREWREHHWYARYLGWLDEHLKVQWLFGSAVGLLLLLALPVFLVGVFQAALQGGILTLLGMLFAALVLVFTLGPRDLGEAVHSLLDARANGDEEAAEAVRADLEHLPLGVQGVDRDQNTLMGVLIGGHERLLAVLLWFYLLGPVGAVLYRLAATLPRLLEARDAAPAVQELAQRIHAVLAWLPQRLTALVYTLAGSTDDALSEWRNTPKNAEMDWAAHGWLLLSRVGCGAISMEEDGDGERPLRLDFDEALTEALALVRRALIISLAVLALLTIGGWLT